MDKNTIAILLGLVVQFLAIVHFFMRLEHRITALEIHVVHLMKRQGMQVRENEIKEISL